MNTHTKRYFPILLLSLFLLLPNVYGQDYLKLKKESNTLKELLDEIKKQTDYQVFYNEEKVNTTQQIHVTLKESTIEEVLKQALTPLKLTYEIINTTIVISEQESIPQTPQQENGVGITGIVYDEHQKPLPGATVIVKGSSIGTATDHEGKFSLRVKSLQETLYISFIGYVTKEIKLNGKAEIKAFMEADIHEIETVIATGYFPKAKNSFTGTAVVVKGEELRNVNNVNFFDALKVFDPSFKVVDERGTYGSDPNRIPDRIEIRGQNSFPEISESNLQTYTSLPVFILDGFEITVEQVYDLDMNRIEGVTILKDAAASAIYGSRAANGIVVIESKNPGAGKLQISYTLNGSIQLPDLSSYKLMNAAEILEFQRLAGVFDPINEGEDGGNRLNYYYAIKKEVMEGTDTYWISKPLQLAFLQKHSVFIEGAVKKESDSHHNVRYQINLSAGSNKGVMKGSVRNQYGGGTKILYTGNKLNITNDLQFSMVTSKESPYGKFSTYTQTLPYFREKDENGKYYRTLTMRNVVPDGIDIGLAGGRGSSQQSPVYEAKYLSSFTHKENIDFYNNFGLNWTIAPTLLLKGNFRFSHNSSRSDAYVSPMSHGYIESNDGNENSIDIILDRGKYELGNFSSLSLSGNVVVSYTENFGKHLIQAILGGEIKQQQSKSNSYTVTGFMDDALDYISYANQFKLYGRPGGSESTIRNAGAFTNINYSYDNRYLIDLTGRIDGSSLFGRNQRTAPFWSAGIRWNISREPFMARQSFIKNLALRATIGTIGNQNFSLNQAMTLYSWLKPVYGSFMGAAVTTLGNADLECQITYNRNVGIEVSLWDGKINLDLNYYNNITKKNLTDITIAPSIGFKTFKTNMGDLENKGLDFSLSLTAVRKRDWTVNFHLNGRHNTNTIKRISEALKQYNDMIGEIADRDGTNVFLFEEGQSMNSIYAVRSLGIDPGTGKEMYLTANGERSFDWEAKDQLAVGNQEATLEGYFGFNLRYRAWDLGSTFNYSTGADKYNHTLHDKIEGSDPMVNNDKRALSERWKNPGDLARYKSIRDDSRTKSTSRFVQKEHMMSLTSLRISYTIPTERWRNSSVSMMRFSATMNDLFYISTIKQERGLSYPFARTINFSAQINF